MGKITGKPNGRPLLYESSEDGISNPEPYTMSGLAYALEMDRKSLLNYKRKDEFFHTVQRARNKVEADVERRMSDRDTFTPGLIFNAKNNFDWKDKSEQDVKVQAVQPLFDIERVKLEDNISDKI